MFGKSKKQDEAKSSSMTFYAPETLPTVPTIKTAEIRDMELPVEPRLPELSEPIKPIAKPIEKIEAVEQTIQQVLKDYVFISEGAVIAPGQYRYVVETDKLLPLGLQDED
jgi:hypothetical protein